MPRPRRGALLCAAVLPLLLLAAPAPAQGPVQPPVTTFLQSWPLSITPNDIAPDPRTGVMAVVDAGNSRIQLLRPGGTNLAQIRGLKDPRSAAFTPDGKLLVGEAGTGSVKGYSIPGQVLMTLGSPVGEFLTPNDIAVHPSGTLVYVVDSAADMVKVYSLPGGTFQFSFGASGTGDGQLLFPISASVDAGTGEVFVGDSRNRRIAVFDADDGSFLRNIGAAGSGDGEIAFVGGLHVDPNQHLFVVESLGGFVQVLDPFGGFVSQIGDRGAGPGMLRSPKAVVVDRYNRLLVTSFLDRKIEVWGLDGYENPVDQDLVANVLAIPRGLTVRREEITVTVSVPGIDPGLVNADSIRVSGIVQPVPGSLRLIGPHLAVKLKTGEILAVVPPRSGRQVSLSLTASTFGGLRILGSLDLTLVAPQFTFQARQKQFPTRRRYLP